MTARLNYRLSSVFFFIAFAALIFWALLAFYVPHLEAMHKQDPAPLSTLLSALLDASHQSQDRRLSAIPISLFALTLCWRIVAAKRFHHQSSRGFDVV
jgi:type II secretory pathway component PulF